MKLQTLRAVDGVLFGSSPDAIVARGSPTRRKTNRRGETEIVFPEVIFRFAAEKFVESSFKTPSVLEIDGETVPFDGLLAFMKKKDGTYFEAVGFGVAPRLGLAFDLDHD